MLLQSDLPGVSYLTASVLVSSLVIGDLVLDLLHRCILSTDRIPDLRVLCITFCDTQCITVYPQCEPHEELWKNYTEDSLFLCDSGAF
jgi:hypothetical protein